MGAVAQRLCFVADRGGVFGGLGRAALREGGGRGSARRPMRRRRWRRPRPRASGRGRTRAPASCCSRRVRAARSSSRNSRRPSYTVTTPVSGSNSASISWSSFLRAISRTQPEARWRTMRISSSAVCSPAAASTDQPRAGLDRHPRADVHLHACCSRGRRARGPRPCAAGRSGPGRPRSPPRFRAGPGSGSASSVTRALLAGVKADRGLLEPQRLRRRGWLAEAASLGARLDLLASLWFLLGRRPVGCGRLVRRAGRRARRPAVPGWSNAALSRSLSARSPTWSRAVTARRRADQVRAGATLLRGDDRPEHPVDRLIEPFDDRVVLVESGAVDLDHELGAGACRARRAAAARSPRRTPRRTGAGRRGGPRSPRGWSRARRGRSGSPARRGGSRARTPATAAPWRGARRSCADTFGATWTSASNSTGRSGSGSGAG